MKTIIIYDNNGYIFLQRGGNYDVPQGGVQYLEFELPDGKRIVGVDITITPNAPIFEDIQLSETEQLQKRIEEQELALIELASLVGGTV